MSIEFRFCLGAIVALFILLLVWLAATPASAEEQALCGPRREVIDRLGQTYGEEKRWFGVSTEASATVYLLLVSDAGSWTLLKVMPDVACAVAVGTDSNLMFGDPA